MNNTLRTVAETNKLIADGKILHIAGEESALTQLHQGKWIGGTIPYFLTPDGGVVERHRVLVTELSPSVIDASVRLVDAAHLNEIAAGSDDGFTLVIVPGMSEAHVRYATGVYDLAGLFRAPIAGWVAGVHLDELGKQRPRVFNGMTGEASAEQIAVLHARLPPSAIANIGIINLFEQGDGDRIEFAETGFSADACRINGQSASFFEYVKRQRIDPRLPLVADASGEMINVSFQSVDEDKHTVTFYAPVLSGTEYRQAAPIADYRDRLLARLQANPVQPLFSCNCILNYLYAGLEGDQPIPLGGPATFGEIAYVLLNQTLVYLELVRR